MADDSGRYTRRHALALFGAAGLAGCSATRGDPPSSTTTRPPLDQRYDVELAHDRSNWSGLDREWRAPTTAPPVGRLNTETVVENMEIPWDLSFARGGTLFISERVGRVLAVAGGETSVVTDLDDAIDAEAVAPGEDHDSWWVKGGEGGTLGVAAHPAYPEPPLVYVYYTRKADGEKRNRVVAFDVEAGEVAGVVVDDVPADAIHNGGRITFGPENYLWVTCGDAGDSTSVQDTATLHGTVLRLRPNGDPAPGNPDLGSGSDPRIYTYGHRNPQGIVWLPDGTPLVTEHGPDGWDECNRLEAGGNYGWPEARTDAEYPGTEFHRPLASSHEPSWAPTGSLCYTGEAIPELTNRVLIGGLYSQQVLIATVTPPGGTLPPVGDGTRHEGDWLDDAYTVTTHPALQNDLGRVRHVEQGPDGGIYLVTSNRDGRAKDPFPREGDDRLLRLTVE